METSKKVEVASAASGMLAAGTSALYLSLTGDGVGPEIAPFALPVVTGLFGLHKANEIQEEENSLHKKVKYSDKSEILKEVYKSGTFFSAAIGLSIGLSTITGFLTDSYNLEQILVSSSTAAAYGLSSYGLYNIYKHEYPSDREEL